jgi:Flp pilus assembly protein TadG
MRELNTDDRGVITVEFALIVPLLILLTVGLLDIARAVNAEIVLGASSEEGAHYAILHPTAAPSAIASAAQMRAQPLTASSITVTAQYYDTATAAWVAWPSAGIPASSPSPQGVLVRISVSYPWSAVSMVADTFFSGTPSRTLTASSLMETQR